VDRDAFIGALAERNVGVGLHFPPCHLLSYVRERFGRGRATCRTPSGRVGGSSRSLCSRMTDGDVEYVCEAVREILGGARDDLRRRPIYNEEPNSPC